MVQPEMADGSPQVAVDIDVDRHCATITIDRPQRHNALNAGVIADLGRALDQVLSAEGIGALFITGTGERSFCAGADLDELQSLDAVAAERWLRAGHELFDRILRLPIPSVAVINGLALGGGLELALSCSLAIACDEAKLGLPEAKLGLLPGLGGTQRLAALVGRQRALRLILTGAPISAGEAWELGMLSHPPVRREALADLRAELAAQLVGVAPTATAAAIGLLVPAGSPLGTPGIDDEIAAAAAAIGSSEGQARIDAFLHRSSPAVRSAAASASHPTESETVDG